MFDKRKVGGTLKDGEAKLGHKYRDTVTGFEGTAIAIVEWLYACRRITLSNRIADGSVKDYTFDEPQLEAIPDAKPVEAPQRVKTGGGRPTPARMGVE